MTANTDFVQSVVGGLSGTLGNIWDANVSQLVVDDSLEAYGVDTEADMTDTTKKKTLLRYFTWQRIRDELILDPTKYSADGESFDLALERLDKRVAEAKVKALPYLSDMQIGLGRMTFPDDPYSIDGQVEHEA